MRGVFPAVVQHGKGTVTLGLPDLASDIEIKTLDGAKTYNTFSSQVSNGVKKDGLTRLVIDVSQNPYVDDDKAIEWVKRRICRYPHIDGAFVVGHGKQMIRVNNPRKN